MTSPTLFDPALVQALLFDLDGTLVESTADLVASGNWLRARHGLPALESHVIAGFVGDGVESLMRRLLAKPEGDVRDSVEAFLLHYHEHCLDQTRLYPAVAATLEALQSRGYAMAVVTNKPERVSRRILEGLGVAKRFGSVVGGNTCAHKKPHPEPLFKACGDLSCEPKRGLMVGDSRVDVEAGHNAGMPSVGILGGIADESLMKSAAPEVLIQGFERLLEIL